jgi:hypothetical protein
MPPSAAATDAPGPSVLFGIGLSMAIAMGIFAGLFARSLLRERREGGRPWKKPCAAVQQPGSNGPPLDPAASEAEFVPAPCEIDVDSDWQFVSDCYASDSEAFVLVEGPEALPDSPYDTESDIC